MLSGSFIGSSPHYVDEMTESASTDARSAEAQSGDLARDLLAWYDRHARNLPWRVGPHPGRAGRRPDPYWVWLSEVTLQLTTVTAAAPYFLAFVERWPTVDALAAAALDELLAAWAGLGYYARARNLHACARVVAGDLGGCFPETEAALLALPGIGPYTAAAIAAIAFDRPAAPVDGNVERVVARLFSVETPLPAAKPVLRRLARDLTPTRRPGDFAQGLMDLGATVCLPRRPRCSACPLSEACAARAAGRAGELPRRTPKKPRPTRRGVAFWTLDPAGRILLRRRPETGLLGGMMELPGSEWREAGWETAEAWRRAPIEADWSELPGLVRHTFTHFHLELTVWAGRAADTDGVEGRWVALDSLAGEALPSVMRKVVRHALARTAEAADR